MKYYIHGAGLMAMVKDTNEVYTYHYDAVGNTIAMTDETESIINSYAYTPFGILANENETVPQAFKFVGKYGVMTEPDGFYYMRARYYDTEIGRFISEDLIGFDGGDVNLYAYVGNNPMLLIDPFGLCSELSWGNAMGNYFFGGGQDLNVSVNDVYPQHGLNFGGSNQIGYDTDGPAGRIVFEKLGNGNIIANPDRFDFDSQQWGIRDPGGFPYPKEVSTRVGAMLPGTPYNINFEGQINP